MPLWKQALFSRLQAPLIEGGDLGGGEGGDDAAALAAAADASALAANGGVKPTDAEAKLLKEVMQKKTALTAATTAVTELTTRLKEFDGIDPVAVRALLAQQKTAETAALEAAGEWTRLKDRMSAEHTVATGALQTENAALKAQLAASRGSINDLSIGTRFGSSTFITDELVLTPSKTRIVYGDHFDLVDGKVVGYDKPRGATNRTALVDQHGNSVDFDAALRKIVEADPDKDHMLKSKVKAGAGSNSKANAEVRKPEVGATSLSKIAAGMGALKVHG